MIGVLVLAAGEGSRFRGNKLLARINGIPILGYVLRSLPQPRLIVAGKYAAEIIHEFPKEVVMYNPNWREGMSTSIKLGLRYFMDSEGILVALGDMPLITKETVEKILGNFSPDCSAVVPIHQGTWGNPVVLSRELYDEIWKLDGDTGAKKLLKTKKSPLFRRVRRRSAY